MRSLLFLPLLLGLISPAIAHNKANGGCGSHCDETTVESSTDGAPCTSTNSLICDPFVFNSESDE